MVHGGDIYTEGILRGRELIDFSSNINPLGIPKSFDEAVQKALQSVVNYPDVKYRAVREALGRYEGIQSESFVLGNGAAEIIDLSLKGLERVIITAPSFAEYEISAKKWGASIQYMELLENKNIDGTFSMEIDYEKLLELMKGADGAILANPNNPDGSMLDKDKMIKILDYCQENGKRMIIDEAFIHFTLVEGGSFVELTQKYDCLMVIKALTKYYGMPGIRFGYGITSDDSLRAAIEGFQNPWNINTFAEEGVKAVLFDEEYNKKSIRWIQDTREGFIRRLLKVGILSKVYRTRGNYVLCELKDITAKEFYDRCLKRGFLIRNGDNYRGLTDRHIRLAIKDDIKNEKLFKMFYSEFV